MIEADEDNTKLLLNSVVAMMLVMTGIGTLVLAVSPSATAEHQSISHFKVLILSKYIIFIYNYHIHGS